MDFELIKKRIVIVIVTILLCLIILLDSLFNLGLEIDLDVISNLFC